MKTSEQVNELAAAMAKAQGELEPAVKDATNAYYDSKYADIAAVWEVCRRAFPPNGLSIFQDLTNEAEGIACTTRIIHTSGQWIEFGPLFVPLAKHDAHGVGSACSYGRRYGLGGATGIVAQGDDDGNAAAGVNAEKKPEHHADHIERGAASTTPPAQRESEALVDPLIAPSVLRPSGLFGYGKKFVDTPWNLMAFSQLEWFRDADRTPGTIRDKCRAEIAWRNHERAKADAQRIPPDTHFDDEIPMN